MTFISVIIPVYNIKEYLEECLNSVLDQAHNNIEVIIVNDGSTDGSQIICEIYNERYKQIKLINKVNGGLSDARNVGLLNATGEYVMFLDGDDFLQDNILNSLEKFILSRDKPDIVMFDYIKFFQNSNNYESVKRNVSPEIINKNKGVNILKYLLKNEKNLNWMVWQAIYRKELLMQNKLFFKKGRLYEDVLWSPSALALSRNIEYFEREVYIYRLEREGQITSTISQKSLIDNIYVPIYWSEKLEQLEIDNELQNLLMENIITRYYYSIWFLGFLKSYEKKVVVELLEDNKGFLKYTNGLITKITRSMVKVLGLSATSVIFKIAITIKRRITI